MSNRIISFEAVSKAGKDESALLSELSFAVESGESLAFQTSGESADALFELLTLLSAPDSGRYELDGTDTAALSEAELSALRSEKIGIFFPHNALLEEYDLLGNLLLPLKYAGLSRSDRMARAVTTLEAVGLSEKAACRIRELSPAEQSLAAAARAILNHPCLLVAYEPALFSEAGEKLTALFRETQESGGAVLLITADTAVSHTADRIFYLSGGKIIGSAVKGGAK